MSKGANVLFVGYTASNLLIERSKIPAQAGYGVYWLNWFSQASPKLAKVDWLGGVIQPHPWGRLRVLRQFPLYKAFIRLQPCLVHVHYALSQWPYAKWVGRLHPLVVSAMGGDIMPEQGFNGEFVAPTKHLLEKADIVTCKSGFMSKRLQEIGVSPEKIRRVTWGMDVDRFQPGLDTSALSKQLGISGEETVFFCARVCEPRTNKETVIRAFARLMEISSTPAVLLVSEYLGDEDYRKRVRQVAADLGVMEHVRFLGEVPYEEMPLYYNLARATLSVASSDGMPQTVYQAMSCGTYLILSDIPETRELSEDGFELSVSKTRDEESLAHAMHWVAENRQAAKAAGLRNRPRVTPLADKKIQDRAMIDIYHELLRKPFYKRLLH